MGRDKIIKSHKIAQKTKYLGAKNVKKNQRQQS